MFHAIAVRGCFEDFFSFLSQASIERLCLENNQLLLDLVFGFFLWWSFCLFVFRGYSLCLE